MSDPINTTLPDPAVTAPPIQVVEPTPSGYTQDQYLRDCCLARAIEFVGRTGVGIQELINNAAVIEDYVRNGKAPAQ